MNETCTSREQKLKAIFEKYRGHPEFLGLEINDPNQTDVLLHLAVRHGDSETIKTLAELGANVSLISDLGNKPPHQADIQGQVEPVTLPLEPRAETDIKNALGPTPYDIAVISRLEEIIR